LDCGLYHGTNFCGVFSWRLSAFGVSRGGLISAFASVFTWESVLGFISKFSFPGERGLLAFDLDVWILELKIGRDKYMGNSVVSQHNANIFLKSLQS
jgi:hypothetical protein